MKPTASEVIDALGGTGKVAVLFELSPTAISLWRKRGIPKSHMRWIMLKRKKLMAKLFGEE